MTDVSFESLTTRQLVAAYNALSGKSVGPNAFKTREMAREKVRRAAAIEEIDLEIVAKCVADLSDVPPAELAQEITKRAERMRATHEQVERPDPQRARDKAIEKRARMNGGDDFAHKAAEGEVADAESRTRAALEAGDQEGIKAARDKMTSLGLAEEFEQIVGDVLGEVQNGLIPVTSARAIRRVQHPPMKARNGADLPRYGTDKFWILVMMARAPGGVSHTTLQKLTGWQRCTSTPKILARDLGVLDSYKREKRDGDIFFSCDWPSASPLPEERHPLETEVAQQST